MPQTNALKGLGIFFAYCLLVERFTCAVGTLICQVPDLWREVQFHVGSLLRSLAETQATAQWCKVFVLKQGQAPEGGVSAFLLCPQWLLGTGPMTCSMRLKTNCFSGKEMTSRAQPLVQVCLEYGLTGILPLNDVSDLRSLRDILREKHCHNISFAAS